jgi:3-(3-hydroxy-phenyl)propionate hydroxylase
MVNSGRLSTPTIYQSALATPDAAAFAGGAHLGAPIPDAPLETRDGKPGYLLERLAGAFAVLYVAEGDRPNAPEDVQLTVIGEDLIDRTGIFAARFDAKPGSTYVVRPDQHLTARFRSFEADKVRAAVDRALGKRW